MPDWSTFCDKCCATISVGDQKPIELKCPGCGTLITADKWKYDGRTREQLEEALLKSVFLCPKCGSQHSKGGEDLSGQVCCSLPGKYYCDGILRKITKEELFGEYEKGPHQI